MNAVKLIVVLQSAIDSVAYMENAGRSLYSANEMSKGVGIKWAIFFMTLSGVLLWFDWLTTVEVRTT